MPGRSAVILSRRSRGVLPMVASRFTARAGTAFGMGTTCAMTTPLWIHSPAGGMQTSHLSALAGLMSDTDSFIIVALVRTPSRLRGLLGLLDCGSSGCRDPRRFQLRQERSEQAHRRQEG